MTPFMIYLLVGALLALILKLSGGVDKALERDSLMSNTLKWQIVFFVVTVIFWAPVIISEWFKKRKGE
jgi:uncharacterized membrane protein